MKPKQRTDYTLLALAISFFIACLGSFPGCYTSNSPVKPQRYLLEMGYNTKVEYKGEIGHPAGCTIDAIYVDGKDTVSVKGISQEQYDSLNIAE